MSTSDSWGENGHTMRCTIRGLSQLRLVSNETEISAALRPTRLGKDLTLFIIGARLVRYWPKNAIFLKQPLINPPPRRGVPLEIGYQAEKKFADIFIRLDIIHECDGQSDRESDTVRQLAIVPRLRIASCGKKNCMNVTSRTVVTMTTDARQT